MLDKSDLKNKGLIVLFTMGLTSAAPYLAPFISFLAPALGEYLKNSTVAPALGEYVKNVLPNIGSSALFEMRDSFQPKHENHDILRLLASAYSEAIDEFLRQIAVEQKYKDLPDITKNILNSIKNRIDDALQAKTVTELTELFPSKEYFENRLTAQPTPEETPFYLKIFGFKKFQKAAVVIEEANEISSEEFIIRIAEDSQEAKKMIVDEVGISLKRWFKEENPSSKEFPKYLETVVFKQLSEIIPQKIGELVKTPKHNLSWIAFQRAYLQAIYKELENNKQLTKETVDQLRQIAGRLNNLSNLDGVPEKLAQFSESCLLEFKTLKSVIDQNQSRLIEWLTKSEERLFRKMEELGEDISTGNASLEAIKSSLEELKVKFDYKDILRILLKESKPDSSKGGLRRFMYINTQDYFAGRDDIVNQLRNEFLARPNSESPKFQYCYMTGQAGVGKSRLALELINKIDPDWTLSKFVPQVNIDKVIRHLDDENWKPSEPTFLVIDYAAESSTKVKPLLISLAGRKDDFVYPIRFLLLARSSDQEIMKDLIPKTSEGGAVEDCVLDEIRLGGLNEVSCIEIMRGRIRLLGGNDENFSDAELIEILDKIDPNRRPLLAAMAGELIAEKAAFLTAHVGRESGQINQQAAIDCILERETDVWAKRIALLSGQDQKTMRQKHERLLALATMTRGVALQDIFDKGSRAELDLLPSLTELDSDFYEFISDHAFPKDDDRLYPLEPDLLGEGLIEFLFKKDAKNRLIEQQLKEFAWRLDPFGMAEFAILFEFDFGKGKGNPLRFLPKVPPLEPLARFAVSHALASITYMYTKQLLKRDKDSNWLPDPLVQDEREEFFQVYQDIKEKSLSSRFGTESEDFNQKT